MIKSLNLSPKKKIKVIEYDKWKYLPVSTDKKNIKRLGIINIRIKKNKGILEKNELTFFILKLVNRLNINKGPKPTKKIKKFLK